MAMYAALVQITAVGCLHCVYIHLMSSAPKQLMKIASEHGLSFQHQYDLPQIHHRMSRGQWKSTPRR